ncbi:Phosphoacetylglucosamine mutase [Polychaeton citri CBS 116435]|uniref:Phosphoacetylglucosamine mutase n=1 Tax=Polychaeton citri CBS 116435 TaxID=1314669 RepID=A0A9P4Q0D6_9PEZI|nr:Phosphoacetylglucosamine mutase [Polychaeton citri CBS 116435]
MSTSLLGNLELAWRGFERPDVKPFVYGTAGFRMKEDQLDSVCFTVGTIAALRSLQKKGQAIGIMITASHNRAEDNGVKIVDPMGEMLETDWEAIATSLSNAKTALDFKNFAGDVIDRLNIDVKGTIKPRVIFARDTRPSGERLIKAVTAALGSTGTKYDDCGILTTPQLHYLVRSLNTQNSSNPYGEFSEDGYYKKISSAFAACMQYQKPNGSVVVDCANGVGAPALKKLIKYLPPPSEGGVEIKIKNDDIKNPEVLNKACGADHVKSTQTPPSGFDSKPYQRCASLDGDADRIVYYFCEEGAMFRLLDGDRIATLAASFIGELVQQAGLSEKIKIGIVQTAYANGAATKYVEQGLKLEVKVTPTGVKHLHHAAERFDVGVYFEANGHGTVLFSPKAYKRIHTAEPESPRQLEALNVLRGLTEMINQTVGDALSDLLLVEVILAHKHFTVKEWLSTYTDLPNKLIKVLVASKDDYKTVSGTAERKLAEPKGLQEQIDAEVAKYNESRCFVRASGTENAVRVYGEAASSHEVDSMMVMVRDLVQYRSGESAAAAATAQQQG